MQRVVEFLKYILDVLERKINFTFKRKLVKI